MTMHLENSEEMLTFAPTQPSDMPAARRHWQDR
jgi:hypothetical protein